MPPTPWIVKLIDTLSVTKWWLLFAGAVVFLPLSAVPGGPAHLQTTEGIFCDLGWFGVLSTALAFMAASWTIWFAVGMQVEGAHRRLTRQGPDRRPIRPPAPQSATADESACPGDLLGFVERHFRIPVSPVQSLLVHLTAAPALVVCAWKSTAGGLAWLAVGAGIAISWAFAWGVAGVVRAAVDDQRTVVARRLASTGLVRVAAVPVRRLEALVGWIARRRLFGMRPFGWLLDASEQRVEPDHLLAVTGALVFAVAWGLLGLATHPGHGFLTLPTAALAMILFTALLWLFGGVEYHLSRSGRSPLLLIVALVVIGSFFERSLEHHFPITVRPGARNALPTPHEVATAAGGGNVVVVCAAGGGILAAGWATRALDGLVTEGGVDPAEIRLISGVSGGAVGAAFWIHGCLHRDVAAAADRELVHAASIAPSLPYVTWGLTYPDFVRAVTLGQSTWIWPEGRGALLDEGFRALARSRLGGESAVPLGGLVDAIRSGRAPAPIFNTTAMETGRRVMISPLRFAADEARAPTLSEYCLDELDPGRVAALPAGAPDAFADLDMWTAARLSATFPFVTPAATTDLGDSALRTARHHFVDGGYFDNYGVASALDWCSEVLRDELARPAAERTIRRLLIVSVRVFPPRPPVQIEPTSGFVANVLGPLIGVTSVRDGTATTRNRIELERFVTAWRQAFGESLRLETVELQPDPDRELEPGEDREGPLSWQMTQRQIDAMESMWRRDQEIRRQLARVRDALGR
ncbi:MAG: patatin-like phospholipase family protein [Planctomycetes bacterium]|nr:patatin-like phospholipase family protein [Planctomycetota bacterium]